MKKEKVRLLAHFQFWGKQRYTPSFRSRIFRTLRNKVELTRGIWLFSAVEDQICRRNLRYSHLMNCGGIPFAQLSRKETVVHWRESALINFWKRCCGMWQNWGAFSFRVAPLFLPPVADTPVLSTSLPWLPPPLPQPFCSTAIILVNAS